MPSTANPIQDLNSLPSAKTLELRPRKMTLCPMRDAAQDIRADKSQKSFMLTKAKKQQRTTTDTKCMRAM